MTEATTTAETLNQDLQLIARIDGNKTGPVIIAIGGIHGNEPFGEMAIRTVSEEFVNQQAVTAGTFLGISANPAALSEKTRFIDEDMNRIWFPSIIDKIRRSNIDEIHSAERKAIKSLLGFIEPYLNQTEREVIFVDLHSFSASGGLFVVTPRSEKNIRLLESIGVPLIFDIDKDLSGTVLKYVQDLGHTAFAFEGGSHNDPQTLKNMVSFLMILCCNNGVADKNKLSSIDNHQFNLQNETHRFPRKAELVYRHIIEPEDNFEMLPGFENFQPVQRGDWLANDRNGKILAPDSGYMLMPLYQKKGDDGFFIVQNC